MMMTATLHLTWSIFFLVLWPVCDALSSLFSMMLQTSVHRTKTNIGVTEIMTLTAISRSLCIFTRCTNSNLILWMNQFDLIGDYGKSCILTQILQYKVANSFFKIFRFHDSCEKQLSSWIHGIHLSGSAQSMDSLDFWKLMQWNQF